MKTAGSGPPLLYLHAAGGPIWDPFVEGLASTTRSMPRIIRAPGETARDAIYAVENLWDLVLIYEEILDALNLTSVPVIGTSFGGMMACELAAHRPERVSKMVLLDPIGLWRDDAPVAPYMLMPPEKLVATLYKHLDSAAGASRRCKCRRSQGNRGVYRRPGLGARRHWKVRLADTRQGSEEAAAPRQGADPDRLGRRRRVDLVGLRQGVRRTHRQFTDRNHQGLRSRPAGRAARIVKPMVAKFLNASGGGSASAAADCVFEEVRVLQPGELDGKAVLEMAHHAALHLAERDQRADRRPLLGGDAGARLRHVDDAAS